MNKKDLEIFCSSHGFILSKILDSNKRKDTVIILVEEKSSKFRFVVKIYGESAPENTKRLFKNEIEFYANNKSKYIPKMIITDKNFLVLNYIDGKTIREYIDFNRIQNNDEKPNVDYLLVESIGVLDWFYSLGKGVFESTQENVNLILDTLMGRIRNLIKSGPKNTSRSKFEDLMLNLMLKVFFPLIKKKIKKRILVWRNNNFKILSSYGNTDLHVNNFLVDSNGLKLIDFENIISPGVWLSDILYFYASFYACFYSKTEKEKIKTHAYNHILKIEPKFKRVDIISLLDIFCSSAEANSRFRLHDKGLKINKIMSFILFVIRFS